MIRNVAKQKEYKILILGDAAVGKTTMLNRRKTGQFDADTDVTIGVNIGINKIMNHDLYKAAGLLGITEFEQGVTNAFQYWDLGGQKIYDQMRQVYFQGASGIILCFDVSNPETLRKSYGTNGDTGIDNTITRFLQQIIVFFGTDEAKRIPILHAGTKRDIGKAIADERIEYLASEFKKAGLNIISHRIFDGDQLQVFGKWTVGRERFTQNDIGKKWIETSSKTGFHVDLAFHSIEIAVKEQQRLNTDNSRATAQQRASSSHIRPTSSQRKIDLTKGYSQ